MFDIWTWVFTSFADAGNGVLIFERGSQEVGFLEIGVVQSIWEVHFYLSA